MESSSAALGYAPIHDRAGVIQHDHEHPPEANRSSRVDATFLGILLFIISEVMLFGAFFTAYFFVRAVGGAEWPGEGTELPVAVAGINTAILISSSFTMHWALESAKAENRAGMRVGLLVTLLLGVTFLCIQVNEYVHLDFGPATNAQGTIFYGLTGLHGAHVFVGLVLLLFATIRAFRGHFTPTEHRGVEIPGVYWHFVDIMWIIVFATVYIL